MEVRSPRSSNRFFSFHLFHFIYIRWVKSYALAHLHAGFLDAALIYELCRIRFFFFGNFKFIFENSIACNENKHRMNWLNNNNT